MNEAAQPNFKPCYRLRTQSRTFALQALYSLDVSGLITDIRIKNPLWTDSVIHHHFAHFNAPDRIQAFAKMLTLGVIQHRAMLDEMIKKNLESWKIDRLSSIDRSLLRMAAFEITTQDQTHPSIIINEAIELTKQFSTQESASFVNAVLDKIRLDHESDQPKQMQNEIKKKLA